jgi:AraC-like DNA-binding protein
MQRFGFSTESLPGAVNDQERFSRWREAYSTLYGPFHMTRSPERPFSARFEAAVFGTVALTRCSAAIDSVARASGEVAVGGGDYVFLGINCGGATMAVAQRGRSGMFTSGRATLLSSAEPGRLATNDGFHATNLVIARPLLLERVPHAEDLIVEPLDPDLPALRYLWRYCNFLLSLDPEPDEAVARHIGTSLLDLTTLALGARGDSAHLARMRGLRAIRLQQVLEEIARNFVKPGFSAQSVARKLGLSAAYVQKLLYETGVTFSERVLELRLMKTRAMLSSPRYDHLTITEVALACGFGDVSYFNRCFRRRFGASPSSMRGRD